MLKKLCPYCDHEIGNSSKCKFCGSRVRKPVIVETSAEFTTAASSMPGECDCTVHSPETHPHSDEYRDSTDASFEKDYRKAYESDRASIHSRANTGQRAKKHAHKADTKSRPLKKIIIIYIAIIVLIRVFSLIFNLISVLSPN